MGKEKCEKSSNLNVGEKIIGIDLGTTNSCVSVMEGTRSVVIANLEGSRTTPSIVAFAEDGEQLIGQAAKRQAVTNPTNTIYSIKRFMGRRHNEVKKEEKIIPYKISGKANELVKVDIRGKKHTPPEISAKILRYIKNYCEKYLGEQVAGAVITVPAYFNDSQRQATKDAGQIAGLEVKRIINEPTAAALAYGLDKKIDEKIAVFDLGGGTFDISILEVGDNVVEVLSTNGDTHLGGDDWDELLVNFIADMFLKDKGVDLRKDNMALQRLKEAAEKAKISLSQQDIAQFNLPFISMKDGTPLHLTQTLTRAKFQQLTAPLLKKLEKPVKKALKDAKLKTNDINEVVLIGGMTRVPSVQDTCRKLFKKDSLNESVNPDEVVSMGAAIQGAVLSGARLDVLLLDVTPLSLGIETHGGVRTVLVERNTTIPIEKTETFSTASNNQPAVDIHVLQGERPMANQNRTLGRFSLTGIPPAPRGIPKIEVTFDIDANGILNVSAKDAVSGQEASVEIKSSSGLSEEEIERMKQEAEDNAEEDTRRCEAIATLNKADNLTYQIEELLKEHGDKISEDEKEEIEEKNTELKELIKDQNKSLNEKENIEALMSELEGLTHKLVEALYQSEQEQQPPPKQQAGSRVEEENEESIDADFRVVN